MIKVPRNLTQKFLKNFDYELNKSDLTKHIFEVKKERIAEIIATFEGVIKDLDETPESACILTCADYKPSIHTLQVINEYYSTKKVLLTCKKNGNYLKIMTKQDSMKLHKNFANLEMMSPGAFELYCKRQLQNVQEFKKLHIICPKEYEHVVSLLQFLSIQTQLSN